MKTVMLEREDIRKKDGNHLIKVILPEGEELIILLPEDIEGLIHPNDECLIEVGLNLVTVGHYI